MLDQSEGQNISLLIRPRAHISWDHNVAWGWSKKGESFRVPSGPLLPQGCKHHPPSPLLVFQCILRESSFCSSSLNDSGEEKGGSVMLREVSASGSPSCSLRSAGDAQAAPPIQANSGHRPGS